MTAGNVHRYSPRTAGGCRPLAGVQDLMACLGPSVRSRRRQPAYQAGGKGWQMQDSPRTSGVIAAIAIVVSALSCGEGPKEQDLSPGLSRVEASEAAPPVPSAEAFLRAAIGGDVAALEAAIAAGADLHSRTAEGATALMLASFQGHTDSVHTLLEHGAEVGDKDRSGRTALMYASSGPYSETVGLLLKAGAEVNRTDDVERWSALMFAGGEGLTEVIRMLLSHGADANLKDVDGETALTFAQRNGHEESELLLKAAMEEHRE